MCDRKCLKEATGGQVNGNEYGYGYWYGGMGMGMGILLLSRKRS